MRGDAAADRPRIVSSGRSADSIPSGKYECEISGRSMRAIFDHPRPRNGQVIGELVER